MSWAQPLRDISGLAKAVVVFSVLLTLVDVLSALTSFWADDAYERAFAEGRAATDVFTIHDAVNLLYVVLIPTWILGSLWLSRARANAAQLEPREVRRSPAWAWLGWLVPVVSLWFPKQIVDDSWRVAARANRARSEAPHLTRPTESTTVWWALWLVYLFLSNILGRLAWQADDMTEFVVPWLEVAVAVTSVAALAAWIPVVRNVSREHRRLAGFAE